MKTKTVRELSKTLSQYIGKIIFEDESQKSNFDLLNCYVYYGITASRLNAIERQVQGEVIDLFYVNKQAETLLSVIELAFKLVPDTLQPQRYFVTSTLLTHYFQKSVIYNDDFAEMYNMARETLFLAWRVQTRLLTSDSLGTIDDLRL